MSYDPTQSNNPRSYPPLPPDGNYTLYGAGGYNEPRQQPLLLSEAIRQLPAQYFRVYTRPRVNTFAREKDKAAWNIIWVQVLILAAISAIFSMLRILLVHRTSTKTVNTGSFLDSFMSLFNTINSLPPALNVLVFLISAVITFFISVGIYYLLARAFGGQGIFKQHLYSTLLIHIPMNIFNGLIGLISIVNINMLLILVTFVYQIVLQIYMTMAVHHLKGSRATMAVLILPILMFFLACVVSAITVALLISHIHH